MPRDQENPFSAPSPMDDNPTVETVVPVVEPEQRVEHLPEAWSAEKELDKEDILSRQMIIDAIGPTLTARLTVSALEKLGSDSKFKEARAVLRDMKNKGLGAVIDGDESLSQTMVNVLRKHFPGDFDVESGHESEQDFSPTGLPSQEEADVMSRGKMNLRNFAKEAWGLAKDMGTMAAGGKLTYWLNGIGIAKLAERQERQREKYLNMTRRERRRAMLGYTFVGLGSVAMYMLARHYIADGHSHGGSGGNMPNPDDKPQAPTVIGEHHGHGAFTYIPDEDPARSKLKHGNDWGPAVVGTPDDHGKPAGYAQFFNERLKKSPEQLSATLSEFGLNSKDGGAINDLAAKMRADPKLMEQKYNQLMDHVRDWKTYETRNGGDVGSYYEKVNPDGSLTLAYDDYVNEVAKKDVYGADWDRYIVIEGPNGEKHYFHPACGMQPSHFIPPRPVYQPPVYHAQQYHSTPQPTYQPRPRTPQAPPVYHAPPPPQAPPPEVAPPPPPPPTRPPEVTPPPTRPPEVTPPPPPPPPPVEVKGPTRGEFTPQGPGDFEPAPRPVAPSIVTRPAPNGGNIVDSIFGGNSETGIKINTPNAPKIDIPKISGPVGSADVGNGPISGMPESP